ncbi:MAG: glycosyltransferase [Verrucomicrobiota bacterium]
MSSKFFNWETAAEMIRSQSTEHRGDELVRDPLVTVSIVTYQHREFIEDAVNGVLSQKVDFPFEIIAGDDGSSDGTAEFLLELQRRHPDKVRVLVSKPNLGIHTRNGRLNLLRNLQASRGKYVALVEGDDFWTDPNKLADQVGLLEERGELAGSWHDVEVVGNQSDRRFFIDFGEKTEFTFEDQLGGDCACATGSMVFRRELLPAEWEDWVIWAPSFDLFLISLLSSQGPMAKVSGERGTYRTHEGGITQSAAWKSWSMAYRRVLYARGMKNWFSPRGEGSFQDLEGRYFGILFRTGIKQLSLESLGAIGSSARALGLGRSLSVVAGSIRGWLGYHLGSTAK